MDETDETAAGEAVSRGVRARTKAVGAGGPRPLSSFSSLDFEGFDIALALDALEASMSTSSKSAKSTPDAPSGLDALAQVASARGATVEPTDELEGSEGSVVVVVEAAKVAPLPCERCRGRGIVCMQPSTSSKKKKCEECCRLKVACTWFRKSLVNF